MNYLTERNEIKKLLTDCLSVRRFLGENYTYNISDEDDINIYSKILAAFVCS